MCHVRALKMLSAKATGFRLRCMLDCILYYLVEVKVKLIRIRMNGKTQIDFGVGY